MSDRMEKQSAEFDALTLLTSSYRALCNTAIVDDDYPEARHHFESRLTAFLEAMTANGRFEEGNRYKLRPVSAAVSIPVRIVSREPHS